MEFQEKFPVTPRFLTAKTKRRPGLPIKEVRFIVLHDTGNPGSSANGNVRYYENTRNQESASAHIFVDHKEIVECIPALTAPPEKAWHVRYNVPTDNQLFGADANDAAIGIEYCYGGSIDADEAYKRYIWTAAFICHKFKLDPKTSLVGHFFLDPRRKTDPVTGLAHSRRTYEQLLRDIAAEYEESTGAAKAPEWTLAGAPGAAKAVAGLNLRQGAPNTKAPVARVVPVGMLLPFTGWVENGQSINGNSKWYLDKEGNYFWSGGVIPA